MSTFEAFHASWLKQRKYFRNSDGVGERERVAVTVSHKAY